MKKKCVYCQEMVEDYPNHIANEHRKEFALAWQTGGGGT